MKKTTALCLAMLCGAGFSSLARADDEASNIPHVKSDTYGRCYAKMVPKKLYDSNEGQTTVFEVGKDKDTLLGTFPWFAKEVYLQCNMVAKKGGTGFSLVRFGSWPVGHEANKKQLCLAFYFGGKLLKEYSTLDIAGAPDKVERSVSHYRVVSKVPGYRWVTSNDHVFEIVTTDGRTLAFDPTTGERVAGRGAKPK
jgi:hypothetical protein